MVHYRMRRKMKIFVKIKNRFRTCWLIRCQYGFRGLLQAIFNKLAGRQLLDGVKQCEIMQESGAKPKSLGEMLVVCETENAKSNKNTIREEVKFSLIVVATNACDADVKRTIDSIEAVSYKNKEVFLIAEKEKDYFLKINLKKWDICNGESWKSIFDYKQKDMRGSYFLVLKAGDSLTPYSLHYYAQEIYKHEPDLIYANYLFSNSGDYVHVNWAPAFMIEGDIVGRSVCVRKNQIDHLLNRDIHQVNSYLNILALLIRSNSGKIVYTDHIMLSCQNTEGAFENDYPAKIIFENILGAYLNQRKKKALVAWNHDKVILAPDFSRNPLVSIVVFFNKDLFLDCNLLNSLILFNRYGNVEYIFVVHKDNEEQIKRSVCTRQIKYILYDSLEISFAQAFCMARGEAQGEYLTFLFNGLALMNNDWLYRQLQLFELYEVDAIAPFVVDESNNLPISSLPFLDLDEDKNYGDKKYIHACTELLPLQRRFLSTIPKYCVTVRRKSIEKLEGIERVFLQDPQFHIILSLEMAKCNQKILLDYKSMVKVPETLLLLDKEDARSNFAGILQKWGEQISNTDFFIRNQYRFLLNNVSGNDKLWFPKQSNCDLSIKKILLICHELSRTGTPQVVLKAARVLKKTGYFVVVASNVDGPLRNDFLKEKIPVIIHHTFAKFRAYPSENVPKGITKRMQYLLSGFDLTLVASIVCHNIINAFNGTHSKILWWIHDGYTGFELTREYMPKKLEDNISVFCGGEYARKVLKQYFPQYKADILLYGVENRAYEMDAKVVENDLPLFIMPATFEERKNQLKFVEAIALLPPEISQRARYILVGKKGDDMYYNKVKKMAAKIQNITISQPIPYDDLIQLYREATCIVMPSKDDPLPVVLAEAMMMSKIIICSDMTGTASYIKDGVNGFVFECENVHELSKKVEFVIENHKNLDQLRENGRKTYEREFSEAAFENSLLTTLKNLL